MDALGAAVDAVAAGGAADLPRLLNGFPGLGNGLPLRLRQGIQSAEEGDVLLHLGFFRHAGKDHLYLRQIMYEAEGPAHQRSVRSRFLQQGSEHALFAGQQAALYRFHDDNGLIMLYADLIAQAGLHVFILPVCIVDLQLHKLRLRMGRKDLLQHRRLIVERKARMPDQPLRLQLLHEVPEPQLIRRFGILRIQRMEQIHIKKVRPAALLLQPEYLPGGMLPFGQNRNGQLIRQNKAFPRVTGQQTGPYGLFGMAVVIKIGRVKIGISGRHKIVDHGIELKLIDLPVLLQGQAHGAEAQGFNCVLKKIHTKPSTLQHIFYFIGYLFFRQGFHMWNCVI